MNAQVAVVTGGAGSIGRGVCRALIKAGWSVAVLDVDLSSAEHESLAIECDVTDPEACSRAVNTVVNEYGGVNLLVNMAQRVVINIPVVDLTDEDMRVSYESGPIATLRMMRLCYPHIKAGGGGAIVNFGSGAGTAGSPNHGPYASAKEAIRGITKVAAAEWGRDNIRVNTICPFAMSDPDEKWLARGELNPMGRVGDPETDIGSVVVFLAGPGAFINGRTLHVDGGSGVWH